jgi:cytochrome c-type biogenesis protein
VGHYCVVIVAADTSTELVQRFLNWNGQSRGVAAIKIIYGLLAILGGVWLIYAAL